MTDAGIYIHIPFCAAKCKYCTFVSSPQSEEVQKKYFESLWQEIDACPHKRRIATIFFGGGTPSIVAPSLLCQTLEKIKAKFDVAKDAEITLEANPNAISLENLIALRKAGFNRISFGVQSFEDDVLQKLGRTHTAAQGFFAIEMAKNAGFENINIDLILGASCLNRKCFSASVYRAKTLGVSHISVYMLQLEWGAPLFQEVQSGKTSVLGDEEVVDDYHFAQKMLENCGFMQYEISNFALRGRQCKHNLNYWQMGEYLAFGISAHAFVENKRIANIATLENYLQNPLAKENFDVQRVSKTQWVEEFIMLSLRLEKGLDLEKLKNLGGDLIKEKNEIIKNLIKNNLILIKNNFLKIFPQYFCVSNAIICELI